MKKLVSAIFSVVLIFTVSIPVFAQTVYTVKSGDSMWKIAVSTQTGLAELIKANPSIKNPPMIYPGQKLNIPAPPPYKTLEDEVFRLVNVERVRNGLSPYKQNWEVSRVARMKSQDMINKGYFSHTSPTYGSPFKMMESFGIRFSAAGENIAMGQRTPQEVMNAWMNSPGHRANILNKSFSNIGVGVARNSKGVYYWTQMFTKPLA